MAKLYISKEDNPLYGKAGYPLYQDEYELLPEKHKYIFKMCSVNDFQNAFMTRRNFKNNTKKSNFDTVWATATPPHLVSDVPISVDESFSNTEDTSAF